MAVQAANPSMAPSPLPAVVVVHKKKLDQLRAWLSDASPQSPLIVLLTGPPGCCKATAVRKVAHEAGFTVREIVLRDDAEMESGSDLEHSLSSQVFSSLQGPLLFASPLEKNRPPDPLRTKSPRQVLFLLKNLPVYSQAFRACFSGVLSRLVSSGTLWHRLVVIHSTDASSLAQEKELLKQEAVPFGKISFSPLAPSFLRRALVAHRHGKTCPPWALEAAIKQSQGSLTSALLALDFLLLGREHASPDAPQDTSLFHLLGRLFYGTFARPSGANSPAGQDGLSRVSLWSSFVDHYYSACSRDHYFSSPYIMLAYIHEHSPWFLSPDSIEELSILASMVSDSVFLHESCPFQDRLSPHHGLDCLLLVPCSFFLGLRPPPSVFAPPTGFSSFSAPRVLSHR